MIREHVDASDCLLQGPVEKSGEGRCTGRLGDVSSDQVVGCYARPSSAETFSGLIPERDQYPCNDQRDRTP